MKQVSIYIPAFNAEKHVAHCIGAILRLTYPVEEIVVVDDGSRDQTAKIAAQMGVTIVRHSHNKGLAAARNTGLNHCGREFVAAVDSDCVVEPSWLEACMANFDDAAVGAVGGMLKERHQSDWYGRWRARHLRQHWGTTKKRNPDFLFGSNLVVRNDALGRVGPYLERYRTNYEDVDICRRLKANGLDLVYEPRAVAWHLRQDSASTLLRTYWNWHFHLHEGMPWRRARFHVSQCMRMITKDAANGDLSLLLMDVLAFVTSIYFDLTASQR